MIAKKLAHTIQNGGIGSGQIHAHIILTRPDICRKFAFHCKPPLNFACLIFVSSYSSSDLFDDYMKSSPPMRRGPLRSKPTWPENLKVFR